MNLDDFSAFGNTRLSPSWGALGLRVAMRWRLVKKACDFEGLDAMGGTATVTSRLHQGKRRRPTAKERPHYFALCRRAATRRFVQGHGQDRHTNEILICIQLHSQEDIPIYIFYIRIYCAKKHGHDTVNHTAD